MLFYSDPHALGIAEVKGQKRCKQVILTLHVCREIPHVLLVELWCAGTLPPMWSALGNLNLLSLYSNNLAGDCSLPSCHRDRT